ncbi:MAG: N-acetyltransferase [Deltaproteobacteria bacterium]|nr:MAG: N-acetyltransferase [Deltaproteobacteria bacterium]HEX15699.1 GNAT family N-acetyltransferase [Deltaproteobacteria bacterium]
MRIRTLGLDEFKALRKGLVELYQRAYEGLEEYAYRKPADIKSYLSWLFKIDPEGFFIAEGEKPLGFIACCRHWWDKDFGPLGEVHELAVLPEEQGKGVGTKLLETALEFLGREHDTFGLWVGEGNERAMAFYRRWGFRPVGRMGKWIRMISKRKRC